ncbi:MAG TPA: universal stress protein [Gemmatimonadales bacterium]|nr:universal stress protein [Gemmatimonadales bacterium]
MELVVAADASEPSRVAIRTALRWGARAGARTTILSVGEPRATPALAAIGGAEAAFGRSLVSEGIDRWLQSELDREPTWAAPACAAAVGVPSIEIARFAEEAKADLLVLGRKERSAATRLLVGDTADAVARRSTVPFLFVPGPLGVPERLLVALDGTERGYRVYPAARRIADAIGAALDVVTVEPARGDEPPELAASVPSARSLSLAESLGGDGAALRIRRGAAVREILAEIDATGARTLVVGYRRGGPPGVLEAGSVARQLAHRAPCAVLGIPL